MNQKPILYLISGQIGVGKTTFAEKLEQKTGAIRFTPDEWMLKLYPELPPMEEFDDYFYRCCDIAWSVAEEILKRGGDVILDFGFWKRKDREKYRRKALELRVVAKLYYVQCDYDTIKKRLRERNKKQPPGAITITDEMFDFYSPGFEPPTEEENYISVQS